MARWLLGLALLAAAVAAAAAHGDQPLAKIAIHRSRLLLDAHASISASPSVLGPKGEDTDWVTVVYSYSNASGDDWIGVFSPANFNASICPVTDSKVLQPTICQAPIKYQLANYSSGYVKTGNGTLKFQLINQRSDYSFALFTNGFVDPVLVAISNTISFKNPKAPVFPRLAQGKAWNEITVTWTSGYDITEAFPFVEWGLKGHSATRTPAGTLTFDRGAMCDAPARTVGWRDPGFTHTSFLTNLWPNREYYYIIGHQLLDGTIVWGNNYTFRASPFPGQNSLQRVVIFGDLGKAERDGSNEYNNYQPGSLNTTDTLVKDLDNIDIVFHIGDIVYANGYISQWDQFVAQVAPITSVKPYMTASGNHERDWPNTGSFYQNTDSGGECGVLAETLYYTPRENTALNWYSTKYGLFHFCIADTEQDWREGTPQYKFIESCLASVDRKRHPWLIFIAHRVLGYSSGSFYASQGTYAEPNGREDLQKLWQKYRVDLAFYGHVHNYERTCPIYESNCVSDETTHFSGTQNGTIHVVVGGGGSSLANFATNIPDWSIFRDYDYGFVKLTAYNQSYLLFEYKKSSDGKVYDSFTIQRDYRDVLSCVIDSCAPRTLAS